MKKFLFSKLFTIAAALLATPITWAALAWPSQEGGADAWMPSVEEQVVAQALEQPVAVEPPPPDVIVRRVVVVRQVQDPSGSAAGVQTASSPGQALAAAATLQGAQAAPSGASSTRPAASGDASGAAPAPRASAPASQAPAPASTPAPKPAAKTKAS